jgi:hypothetical protein
VRITATPNLGEPCATFGYAYYTINGALEGNGFVVSVSPGEEGSPPFEQAVSGAAWCAGPAQVHLSLRNDEAPTYENGQELATLPFTIG